MPNTDQIKARIKKAVDQVVSLTKVETIKQIITDVRQYIDTKLLRNLNKQGLTKLLQPIVDRFNRLIGKAPPAPKPERPESKLWQAVF